MTYFHFTVDTDKCIKCQRCIKVCSSACLIQDTNGYPMMKPEADGIAGWHGCYRCQHCLAVCPQGAVSIMGRKPENSISPADAATPHQLEALMRNRRACRRFLDKEVPRQEIDEMLTLLENVPTGSNFQTLNFNVVYHKKEMDKLRKLVRDEAFRLDEKGIYPGIFSKEDFELQAELEHHRNPGDMFFVNAPHILIIHSLKGKGQWKVDPTLAAAWFDLICASRGLGSIIMTYPVGALSKMPEIYEMLQIPENRFFNCIIGFGYAEIPYARGVQREGIAQIKELTF